MNTFLTTKAFKPTWFSTVIFDFDGVILDSETAQCKGWVHALSKYGLDTSKVDPIHIIGVQDDEIVKHLAGEGYSHLRPEIQEEKNLYMRRAYKEGQVGLVEGVKNLIASLSGTHTLAIASNSSAERITSTLDEHGLKKYFKFIIAANKKLPSKPDPAVYLETLRVIGRPASDCLVIEDSIPGLIAAKGAGLFTVAITTGLTEDILKPYSDVVIQSFK